METDACVTYGRRSAGLLAAGGGVDPLVRDIGVCLLFAGVLTVVFARLRIPTIAALLVAGFLLGPHTPGVVVDPANIATIANLGLVLLLFLIGLEMDLRKLLSSGRVLLVTGLLQFPLCVAFGWGLARAAVARGWFPSLGGYAPLYVGITCAASSTLIVVRLLQERHQMDTVAGRLVVGLLILQDVWAIAIVASQPNFSSPALGTVLGGLLGIGLLCGIAFLLSRVLLPAALRWIARTPEVLLIAAAGWCFGLGLLGVNLGSLAKALGWDAPLSVSLEMGALIAGASLASHPFSHSVVSKIATVHDFFITLFFVALGVGIPLPDGTEVLLLAAFLAAVALAARYVVFVPLLYVGGLDRRNSVVASTRLAQISEFCLVIAFLGRGLGHVDQRFVSAVIFAFVATALASPLLFDLGDRIHEWSGGLLSLLGMRRREAGGDAASPDRPVEIALLGFHREASSLFHELERNRPAVLPAVLVVDFNAQIHDAIRARGARVCYGDLASAETLKSAGVDRARVALCTVPDSLLRGTTNSRIVRSLRNIAPDTVIVANALTMEGAAEVYRAGADYVYLRRVETAVSLVPAVEAALGGGIAEFRREREEAVGRPEERREVLP